MLSPEDSAYEQLRKAMRAHAQDTTKWDVWADEDDAMTGEPEAPDLEVAWLTLQML